MYKRCSGCRGLVLTVPAVARRAKSTTGRSAAIRAGVSDKVPLACDPDGQLDLFLRYRDFRDVRQAAARGEKAHTFGLCIVHDSSMFFRQRTVASIPSKFETNLHIGNRERNAFGGRTHRFRGGAVSVWTTAFEGRSLIHRADCFAEREPRTRKLPPPGIAGSRDSRFWLRIAFGIQHGFRFQGQRHDDTKTRDDTTSHQFLCRQSGFQIRRLSTTHLPQALARIPCKSECTCITHRSKARDRLPNWHRQTLTSFRAMCRPDTQFNRSGATNNFVTPKVVMIMHHGWSTIACSNLICPSVP